MAKVEGRERSLLDQLADAVVIDKHSLDECWVEQPDIFWRVSDQLAKANNHRDRLKLERDRVITEVGAEKREDAEAEVERAKKGRVSETAIAREIELDDRVVEARDNYQRAVYQAERWLALKESFQQRSYALKDLSNLHLANYYQTNSGGDRRDNQADEVRRRGGEQRRQRG